MIAFPNEASFCDLINGRRIMCGFLNDLFGGHEFEENWQGALHHGHAGWGFEIRLIFSSNRWGA